MKKRPLMILTGILVILIAVYFFAGEMQKQREKKEEKTEQTEMIQALQLSDITKIKYSGTEGEMSFGKKDDTWYYEKDESVKLTQSSIEDIVDSFANLKALRELKNGDALSDYGLDKPLYTIVLTDKDGNESTVYIGNGAEENYYMTVNDKSKIYTVSGSTVDMLEFDIEALTETETEES